MEQGAYKVASGQPNPHDLPVTGGNEIGSQIKHLMNEIDSRGTPDNISVALQSGGQTAGNQSVVKTTIAPNSIQEARQMDQQYLQQIENKLGLLNNMMSNKK